MQTESDPVLETGGGAAHRDRWTMWPRIEAKRPRIWRFEGGQFILIDGKHSEPLKLEEA